MLVKTFYGDFNKHVKNCKLGYTYKMTFIEEGTNMTRKLKFVPLWDVGTKGTGGAEAAPI